MRVKCRVRRLTFCRASAGGVVSITVPKRLRRERLCSFVRRFHAFSPSRPVAIGAGGYIRYICYGLYSGASLSGICAWEREDGGRLYGRLCESYGKVAYR